MLKRSRGFHPRRQLLDPPELRQEVQNTSVGILPTKVLTLVLNETLAHPWRDQHGWHTNAQAVKGECDVLSVLRRFGVGEVVACRNPHGRRDVVAEAAVLVKGQNEERGVPLRRVADGLIDALDEGLA